MRFIALLLLITILCNFSSNPAKAGENWCKNNGHKIIHWMNGTTASLNRNIVRKKFANFLGDQKKKIGTRLTFIEHYRNIITKRFSACIPGCPESTGFFSGLKDLASDSVGVGCDNVQAKTDLIPIFNSFQKERKKAQNKPAIENIDMLNELNRAANYHEKQKYKQKVEIIFLASMDPLTSKTGSYKDHDTAFVKTVQSIKSVPKSLSKLSVTCIGGNMQVTNFWRDIFEAYSVEPSFDCD